MNKKSVIFNSIIAGLGLFTIIFMAFSYVSVAGFGVSGFTFMQGGTPALILIGLILTVVAAIAMIAAGVVGLLCGTNVIKNEKLAKIFNIISLVAVIIAVVANVLVFVGLIIENMISFIGVGLILNLIISIGALVCGILARKA